MPAQRVCLGVITAPHGVRGMVKVKPFTANPASVAAYGPVMLSDGRRLNIEVKSVAKGLVLARLDEVDDRTEAEGLKGSGLYIERDALPDIAGDEIYQHDLIGCVVEDPGLGDIGTITGVFDFGAGTVLEVARKSGASITLPLGGQRLMIKSGRITLRVDPIWLEEA